MSCSHGQIIFHPVIIESLNLWSEEDKILSFFSTCLLIDLNLKNSRVIRQRDKHWNANYVSSQFLYPNYFMHAEFSKNNDFTVRIPKDKSTVAGNNLIHKIKLIHS